ncbi:MAG: bifunctional diaminohydroxyphosphoribosylaminopyrimidine deaminase/5-amino-6-(5-phosphoribosylamino)uracil reductase RibD [Acidimicrobiia bacterium]|nr:bifunctional diaminohydroxyphosphoribosylaminopyrimidine deaminase/5-amino-6-(5-phosphoribosylamino)uracil reductase RibD [Acidimicrobiia bacterium]
MIESNTQTNTTRAGTADSNLMRLAIASAEQVRGATSPNPWVGAALLTADGRLFTGATEPPGGRHAEIVALDEARAAGAETAGSTLAVTLEPCSHHGRSGPCTEAVIAAGVARVVVGVTDPDPLVAGQGLARLAEAGIDLSTELETDVAAQVVEQLTPYLHHRRTGRPWVVLKLAATLDGGTAAPDHTSQWITGAEARLDAHRLRAVSDAICVGAGTVRDDDPSLTVRLPAGDPVAGREPQRIVLGPAPAGSAVQPCRSESGPLPDILDRLGGDGIVQLMVEGGAATAADFHRQGLVDHYVIYLAPALFGGDDHRPLMTGPGAATIDDLWRGEIVGVTNLGADLRIDLRPGSGNGRPAKG